MRHVCRECNAPSHALSTPLRKLCHHHDYFSSSLRTTRSLTVPFLYHGGASFLSSGGLLSTISSPLVSSIRCKSDTAGKPKRKKNTTTKKKKEKTVVASIFEPPQKEVEEDYETALKEVQEDDEISFSDSIDVTPFLETEMEPTVGSSARGMDKNKGVPVEMGEEEDEEEEMTLTHGNSSSLSPVLDVRFQDRENKVVHTIMDDGFLSNDPFAPDIDLAGTSSHRPDGPASTDLTGDPAIGNRNQKNSPASFTGEDFLHVHLSDSSIQSDVEKEAVLSSIDMLCDDLYYCKTEVLRAFARTRGVSGGGKSDVVLRLIETASAEAHGENKDLRITKQLFGDVFGDDVRTSGVRSGWSNQSLEASHMEIAAERHLKFELMANSNKTLMVRRNAAESGRVLRKLCRIFQQDYPKLSLLAVGSVFRNYKEEADQIVRELSVTDIVSPFSSFLVSSVRYGASMNLLTRADVNQRLQTQLELFQPAMEEEIVHFRELSEAAEEGTSTAGKHATLSKLMGLLDDIVNEVENRELCFGESKTKWGLETPDVLISSAQHFAKTAHVGWSTEQVPRWVEEMARTFINWEIVVRNDIATLADVPRYVFDCILNGVVSFHVLQRIYGKGLIVGNDIPLSMRASIKKSLEQHFGDPEKANSALQELLAYVMSGGVQESRGGVRGEFFAAVHSQMSGALHDGVPSELLHERILVVLKEVTATASRCTRSAGLMGTLVKITEDLRFHLRFLRVFKRLNSTDRKTIRTRLSLNLIKTLAYFEREHNIEPISAKAVAFLVIQLFYMSLIPDGSRKPIAERFVSVTGREELSVIGLTATEATKVQDLRIAFPPQLSYKSWLEESDTKEKSVYGVLPSAAVKGGANQAMIISQAPMMQALDAISRVPWRINKYMLHVQEAIVREGFGFGKIRPGFYPLHYTSLHRGDIHYPSDRGRGELHGFQDPDDDEESEVYNLLQRKEYENQLDQDWKELSELRSSRIHYLQALRQARSLVDFSHVYFPNSMDFRGRMYPLPGRLNHTGSDPFRGILEYAEPKPLGKVGLYWLKVHLANKMGMSKLSFDERAHYVDEHIEDVVQSAERPLSGDRWWQEASEPLQCLMACKELSDALKCSQGVENFLSRVPVAVDGSYNGLQHYSAIGRDAFGAELVNLVPSERPADAYTGILKEMLKSIEADAARDHQVARRCLGTGKGQDSNHIKRKTIKRPIMTQVYGVTGYGMSEQILDELVKQNRGHGLWTHTDMQEMAAYLREKVLESLGVTFKETQNCRKWITEITELIWSAQPAELRNAFCWTTPLGLVVRQPYKVRKEVMLFTAQGYTKVPGDSISPASRKQLSAIAPNLIHSLDATHLAMTALEMQRRELSMMAVHDSYWTYACDLPQLSAVLREQFVHLYSHYDPLVELRQQWEEMYFADLRRHGIRLPDPPPRGTLDLNVVLNSPYFFS